MSGVFVGLREQHASRNRRKIDIWRRRIDYKQELRPSSRRVHNDKPSTCKPMALGYLSELLMQT